LRFLVFRGGALGDILLTLPVLQTLRNKDASAFVELVAPFPAALLGQYGGAHSVCDLNSAAFVTLFADDASLDGALRERLRAVDCVISYLSDPKRTLRTKVENCGSRFISGPFRLGERRLPASVQLAEPLGGLGLAVIDPAPRLFLKRRFHSETRAFFHVGSGSSAKNWPAPSWSALAAKLEERYDELLLISGEADEVSTAEFLRSYRASKLKVRSNLAILDLAHELAAADLFIGHDTGVTHLAAALSVPTIALFGPTDPQIWCPLGENVTAVTSKDGLMAGIPVEQVWSAVEKAHCRLKEL
jgi:heptosyltransferase III